MDASRKAWEPLELSQGPITRGRVKNFKEALNGVMKQFHEDDSSSISTLEKVESHEGRYKNVIQVCMEEFGAKTDQTENRVKSAKVRQCISRSCGKILPQVRELP